MHCLPPTHHGAGLKLRSSQREPPGAFTVLKLKVQNTEMAFLSLPWDWSDSFLSTELEVMCVLLTPVSHRSLMDSHLEFHVEHIVGNRWRSLTPKRKSRSVLWQIQFSCLYLNPHQINRMTGIRLIICVLGDSSEVKTGFARRGRKATHVSYIATLCCTPWGRNIWQYTAVNKYWALQRFSIAMT